MQGATLFMRKHLIIQLGLLTLLNYIFCQDYHQGEIYYTVEFIGELNENDPFDQYLETIIPSLDELTYVLKYNQDSSYYGSLKILENESKRTIYPALILAGKANHYQSKNGNAYELDLGDKTFLVHQKDIKWQLTNDSRKIGEFDCKKAEAIILADNGQVKQEIKVQAWYAAEIPVSYGPKGFKGLPGLILSLTYGDFLYKADRLEFKKVKVPKPKDMQILSEDEFNAMISSMARERFRMTND